MGPLSHRPSREQGALAVHLEKAITLEVNDSAIAVSRVNSLNTLNSDNVVY